MGLKHPSYLKLYPFLGNLTFNIAVRDIHIECSNNLKKLIISCVWAEGAVFGSAKTALKFNYEI